jgi:hypothetical protein
MIKKKESAILSAFFLLLDHCCEIESRMGNGKA